MGNSELLPGWWVTANDVHQLQSRADYRPIGNYWPSIDERLTHGLATDGLATSHPKQSSMGRFELYIDRDVSAEATRIGLPLPTL